MSNASCTLFSAESAPRSVAPASPRRSGTRRISSPSSSRRARNASRFLALRFPTSRPARQWSICPWLLHVLVRADHGPSPSPFESLDHSNSAPAATPSPAFAERCDLHRVLFFGKLWPGITRKPRPNRRYFPDNTSYCFFSDRCHAARPEPARWCCFPNQSPCARPGGRGLVVVPVELYRWCWAPGAVPALPLDELPLRASRWALLALRTVRPTTCWRRYPTSGRRAASRTHRPELTVAAARPSRGGRGARVRAAGGRSARAAPRTERLGRRGSARAPDAPAGAPYAPLLPATGKKKTSGILRESTRRSKAPLWGCRRVSTSWRDLLRRVEKLRRSARNRRAAPLPKFFRSGGMPRVRALAISRHRDETGTQLRLGAVHPKGKAMEESRSRSSEAPVRRSTTRDAVRGVSRFLAA